MKNKKIIFIINGTDPRGVKRAEEFINKGYKIELFSFNRDGKQLEASKMVSPCVIGNISSRDKYFKRFIHIRKSINRIVKKFKNEDVVYYLFQLDIAMAFKMCTTSNMYIYEESDLRHTYMNKYMCAAFEAFDKWVIKKSIMSVFTSEGFLKYHFSDNVPSNVYFLPNRLNVNVLNFPIKEKCLNNCKLRIGYVGEIRYESTISFMDYFCENFPEHQMYFFGKVNKNMSSKWNKLNKKYSNLNDYGMFRNPDQLPDIYSQIDLVLSTYDVKYDNVRYAEPNKLYEAIYFETPIIVSSNTFLSEKVSKLGIGFSVDALNEKEVIDFVKNLDKKSIAEKVEACRRIKKIDCLSINDGLFEKLGGII